MKRFLKMLVIAMVLTVALAVSAFAADFTNCADALHDLGLFQGSSSGYDLDRAPTRTESAVMLVRLLGKETEAKGLTYTAPFTDVPAWAQPYVQYLYDNGLTTGKTADTFGSADTCTAQQYATFLLRALGYYEKDGDFTYANAMDFATEKGVVDYVNCDPDDFLRDDVAAMSYTALSVSPKSGETDLLTKLVSSGAIASDKGYEDTLALYREFSAASESASSESKSHMTMDMTLNATLSGKKVMGGTITMDLLSDVNADHMDQSKLAATGTVKMTMDPSILGTSDNNTMNTELAYYYTDGYYYMNMMGQKVKMPLSYEDALEKIGDTDSTSVQSVCLLKKISKETKAGTTTYTIEYAPAAFNSLMNTISSLTASTAVTDLSFTKMSTTATVKNGKLTNTDIDLGLQMTAVDQPMQMDMTIKSTVVATGSAVNVKLPTDLSSYTLMQTEG